MLLLRPKELVLFNGRLYKNETNMIRCECVDISGLDSAPILPSTTHLHSNVLKCYVFKNVVRHGQRLTTCWSIRTFSRK